MAGGGTEEKMVGWTKFWVSKRLRKWKGKQLMGWVIKIYRHFQSMTHWNIGDWEATVINMAICQIWQDVNSHISIQYVNQSHYILIISPFVGRQRCLQRKYMYRQNETLDCRKYHKLLSNSCHRSGKGHVWNWIVSVKVFGQSGYLFFNRYLRLGNQIFLLFNGWVSKIFAKNISLRCPPPPPLSLVINFIKP